VLPARPPGPGGWVVLSAVSGAPQCTQAGTAVVSRPQDAVDGFVAAEYVNHNEFVEDGREANRSFWPQWFAAFPDTEVSLDDVLVDGDRVADRFTCRATFQGPFTDCRPPAGRW
jgi:predicted ester cyclase